MHPPLSLRSIVAARERIGGELRVQIITAEKKLTKAGKPYIELSLCDGSETLRHSVWSDAQVYLAASAMAGGETYALTGIFWIGDFGLESSGWTARKLDGAERSAVFAGPSELVEKQQRDWDALTGIVATLPEGSLKTLTTLLLTEHEEPFRRAAAARGNHHARRGGLVEHVSLMAQSADALCTVYPELRRDLLIAGVVFHDAGKMVENQYQVEGFEMPFSFRAECYGHIAIGLQLAHRLWMKLPIDTQERDRAQLDALSHLILSHHGQFEWGSPVEPKLPEAQVLHFVDNIDAKLEMMRGHKLTAKLVAPGVHDRHRHLGNLLSLPESLT